MIFNLENVDAFVFLGHALAELFSPLNYAAVKGAKVRLNCSTQNDYNRYWFRSEPLSTEKMLIHHRKMTTNDLFVVDESVPGRLDLLFHLRDETSGRFGCDSVHGTHTAEIILAGQFYAFTCMLMRK